MFRGVVASVLVGALVLAVIIAATVLAPPLREPSRTASTTTSPAVSPSASLAPTPSAGPVLVAPGVVSVGLIARGASSAPTLVLQFLEARPDAIPAAPGSFVVTLTDHAGDSSTVAFLGTPSVIAPGSLRATATLIGPNVLMVSIVASDTYNVELITINGLGIKASPTAAIGPINAVLGDFSGSLVTGTEQNTLASPGSVIAGL